MINEKRGRKKISLTREELIGAIKAHRHLYEAADSLDVADEITLEAWAKPIGINSVGGSPEYGLSYITSFSGTDLKYESNNFSFRVGNILSSQITVWSSAKSLNEFYHIVGTYDGSLIKIYVNSFIN